MYISSSTRKRLCLTKKLKVEDSFKFKGGIDINDFKLLKVAINAGLHSSRETQNKMTEKQKNTYEFFEKNTGEMHVGKAVCFSHDIRISPYVRPKFHRGFIGGSK